MTVSREMTLFMTVEEWTLTFVTEQLLIHIGIELQKDSEISIFDV